MSEPSAQAVETLSPERFRTAGRAWDDLALDVEHPVPFLSHPWLRLWWEHFGAGQEFVCPVVRDGERLLAAAPLAVRRARSGLVVAEIVGTGPVPTRGMGLADKADLLVRRGHAEAGARLAAEVVRLLERVDVLDVKACDADSPMRAALAAQRRALVFERSVSPYLTLSTPWETYLESRSANFRKHLKKYWRLLADAGGAPPERLGPEHDVAAWIEEVFAVNDASWKAARGTDLFRARAIRSFFAALVPEMAARGWIDLHVIRAGGRAVVYELCFDFGGRLFSYNGAYRADLGEGSPGTALTAAVIESACARGRIEYDMLRGPESYKLRWSETVRRELQMLLPAPRAAARVRTLLGPALKAQLKRWRRLADGADRLFGLASRLRGRG
jgi:CelD/BcsL family acetyltransferase involved in cellulose biosynthesis